MTSLTASETALSCDPSCISTLPASTMASAPPIACMRRGQAHLRSTLLCVKLHCKPHHWCSTLLKQKLVMQQEVQHAATAIHNRSAFLKVHRALHPLDGIRTACIACMRTCRATRRPDPAMASRRAAAAACAAGRLPALSCRPSSSSPSSTLASSPPSGLRARMAAVRCQYASRTLVSGVQASCAREEPCNTRQHNCCVFFHP